MKIVIQAQYKYLENYINSIPSTFYKEGRTLYEGRNIIKSFTINNEDLIVKRYKIPNIFQRLIYTFFRKTKAARAYYYTFKFKNAGIDTPDGIGFIEIKDKLLFKIGYFISKPCKDPSIEYICENDEIGSKPILDALTSCLANMHKEGVFHGDLNLSNILYHTTGSGQYHFTFIDINRSHFGKSSFKRCITNLMRTTHNTDIYAYLIRSYATNRGWNETKCLMYAFRILYHFENKRRIKRKFKNLVTTK